MAASAQALRFPEDYLGTWKGVLHIYPADAEVPMSLRLGPALVKDSVYEYVLTYHGQTEDVRKYAIHTVDRAKGLYRVDENNSIVLSERLLGRKLSSVFTVEGSTLMVTLELLAGEIVFEVFSWNADAPETSGGKADVPVVYSYVAGAYQRALLKK